VKRPTVYVIAGPNGAGKSTFYETVLRPTLDVPFINADIIQRNELKDPSMSAAYQAARIADSRREAALRDQISFATETTFSHPSKLELIAAAKAAGLQVVTYHINVRSPELSVKRVATRVRKGGHDVPEDKIRERYERNQALIREAALNSDFAFVYDNSGLNQRPSLAISFKLGKVLKVGGQVPTWARELYAQELEMFSPARLNPASASFADAKAIAIKLGGDRSTLRVAKTGAMHRGTVVGETALHWIQQLDDTSFVAHFKDRLPANAQPRIGMTVAVRRAKDQDVITASTERSVAFANLSAESAISRFPELIDAYKAIEDLEQRTKADPQLSPSAHVTILTAAREHLLNRMDAGQIVAPSRDGKTAPELSMTPAPSGRDRSNPDR